MAKLFQLLFHVHRAAWAAGGGWRVEWLSMPKQDAGLIAVAAAAVGLWLVWLVYRHDARGIHPAVRWSLFALRLVVLASAIVMLLEPALVFSQVEHVPSTLIVLSDASDSMDLHDAWGDDRRAAAVARNLKLPGGADAVRRATRGALADRAVSTTLLDALAANGDRVVRRHSFGSRLLPATTRPTADDRSATAIGVAIRQAIAAYQGQPIAGVLLLTDGQSNAGEPPAKAAEYAAAAGVPVVPVALGTAEGPRYAKVGKMEVSPTVFVRDAVPVRVPVDSRGMTGQPATVVLEKATDGGTWEEVARQPIVLGEAGRVQTSDFQIKQDRPAKLQLRARLEDAGVELNPDDHQSIADVRAIRQKIRVLFIAGETFPEVEFIRAMLLRDTGISASTWLQTADPDYEQPGDPRLRRLPATAEELNDYDCIVLYDPDPNLWPGDYSQLLSDFVAKAGGGLIYVAGERNTKDLYDRPDDPALAWLNLLPVVVEPGLYHTDATVKLSSASPWKLEITPEGRTDPVFQFSDRPEENETILDNLPGMYWHFPVTRARGGATVLARHADPRMRNEHGQQVLLATQLVGPGRTFFVAFDSTYRWRYLDEHLFDSFWAHLVDRAGRSKQLGGRYPYTLSTDRATYRPGGTVTLTARFENSADRDAGLDAMHGEVQRGTDPAVPITLTPVPGDHDAFTATFPVEQAGTHFVRVWAADPGDSRTEARAATLQVPVELPNLELDNPTLDLATLQTIARASGGATGSGARVFDLTDSADAATAFRTRRVDRTLEDRQEVWNAPVVYVTLLVALVLEWVLRKRARLV
jgi:hypothetical protein